MEEEKIINIVPIAPRGTNSTHFTECCRVAICDYEGSCPSCGKKVIGFDAENEHSRGMIRSKNSTRYWSR